MIDVALTNAFIVGLVSVVNPCGFPMLPAYLSWFMGDDGANRVPRAVLSALTVSAGFLVVFAGVGIPINAGVTAIYEWVPWFTIVIGTALALLGIAILAGLNVKLPLPRLDRGGGTRGFRSMFLFGVSYAITSISCTIGPFLVVVAGTTKRANLLSGAVAFGAYGVGFTLLLTALAVSLALAQDSLVRRVRSILRHTERIAGALLVLVGAYLVYYGIYALDDTPGESPLVTRVDDWSSRISAWLQNGGTSLGLVLAGIVAAGVAWAFVRRRTPSP